MAVKVKSSSRLLFGDVIVVDDVEHWDTLVLPDSSPRVDDVIHVVSSSDRIDLLAQRYYQDPVLWWVIAWANDIEVVPTQLVENQELRIPSRNFLQGNLLRSARRS